MRAEGSASPPLPTRAAESVAVPDPSVLAALRRELEAKTAALQAAVASGGPRAAAAAALAAAPPDKPAAPLARLPGLRNSEVRAIATAPSPAARARPSRRQSQPPPRRTRGVQSPKNRLAWPPHWPPSC
jgi:hypothetical protein